MITKIEANTWRELVIACREYDVENVKGYLTRKRGKWIWERV